MARGDFHLFEEFALNVLDGSLAWDLNGSDVIKLGIIDDTATPLITTASPTWADFSENEVSAGGNYVADGITIDNCAYTEADGVATFDADDNSDLTQDGGGFTDAYWGILYNSTLSIAMGFLDLGGPVSEVAGPIVITWGGSGIFTVTITPHA